MNLHYIQQNSLNPFEFQICQAYYENPNKHTTPLAHLQQLCSQYHITLEQLAAITQKVKAYHPHTHCIECNITQRITEPDYRNLQHLQKLDYICDDCQSFIHAPNQVQHFANIPMLTSKAIIDDLPY